MRPVIALLALIIIGMSADFARANLKPDRQVNKVNYPDISNEEKEKNSTLQKDIKKYLEELKQNTKPKIIDNKELDHKKEVLHFFLA